MEIAAIKKVASYAHLININAPNAKPHTHFRMSHAASNRYVNHAIILPAIVRTVQSDTTYQI